MAATFSPHDVQFGFLNATVPVDANDSVCSLQRPKWKANQQPQKQSTRCQWVVPWSLDLLKAAGCRHLRSLREVMSCKFHWNCWFRIENTCLVGFEGQEIFTCSDVQAYLPQGLLPRVKFCPSDWAWKSWAWTRKVSKCGKYRLQTVRGHPNLRVNMHIISRIYIILWLYFTCDPKFVFHTLDHVT